MNRAGIEAEDLALAFLLARGLKLKARNYACRMGEIDLILQERDTLVFVEVRMRRSAAFGGAVESITSRKRDKLLAAARHYLVRHAVALQSTAEGGNLPPCRFDAVLVDAAGRVRWVRDAFGE
jgi:putative endonuclease